MVLLNQTGEEINAKIVYYGPGQSGKTTNLDYIHKKMPSKAKGEMVSMKTRTDRTLFFDFLPIELGEINGYPTRFLMYTVPGQVYYNATRKLVLKGVDALVFVADCSRAKLEENLESLRNLEDNLNEYGLSLDHIPWVIQYNKRDMPDAMMVPELEEQLNLLGVPAFEAVAAAGTGVYETFQGIAGLLYHQLKKRLETGEPVERLPEGADPRAPQLGAAPRSEAIPRDTTAPVAGEAVPEATARATVSTPSPAAKPTARPAAKPTVHTDSGMAATAPARPNSELDFELDDVLREMDGAPGTPSTAATKTPPSAAKAPVAGKAAPPAPEGPGASTSAPSGAGTRPTSPASPVQPKVYDVSSGTFTGEPNASLTSPTNGRAPAAGSPAPSAPAKPTASAPAPSPKTATAEPEADDRLFREIDDRPVDSDVGRTLEFDEAAEASEAARYEAPGEFITDPMGSAPAARPEQKKPVARNDSPAAKRPADAPRRATPVEPRLDDTLILTAAKPDADSPSPKGAVGSDRSPLTIEVPVRFSREALESAGEIRLVLRFEGDTDAS